jgi:hypothetical protein
VKALILFVAVLVGLDQALGMVLDVLYRRTTAGGSGGQINLALRQSPEILVLGNSRASAHISPSVLRSRLSASVFNAGTPGQDFLYAVMLLDLWTRSHHPPAAIILNMDPRSLSRSEEELQRAGVFSAYFGDSQTVRRIMLMRGSFAHLKYLSYSYRFNGKVLPIIKNLVVKPDPAFDGYSPTADSPDVRSDPIAASAGREVAEFPDWEVKLEYLRDLTQYCRENGTRLFLIIAPVFAPDPIRAAWSVRMSRLATSFPGLELLDLSERTHPELFAGQGQLYHDNLHLNAKGAEIFSTLLANEIAMRMGKIEASRMGRPWSARRQLGDVVCRPEAFCG